jgi:hypothetical protein
MTYLEKKKSKVLTLSVITSGGGWCGPIMIPQIGYHVPKVSEHYTIYNVQDVRVYIKNNVNTVNNKLEFYTSSFLFITSLEVKGLKLSR